MKAHDESVDVAIQAKIAVPKVQKKVAMKKKKVAMKKKNQTHNKILKILKHAAPNVEMVPQSKAAVPPDSVNINP